MPRPRIVCPFAFGLLLAAPAAAQSACTPSPLPTGPRLGADGAVLASVRWDPDGTGPAAEQLVVAGNFHELSDQRASIARFDATLGTWTRLGSVDRDVRCLAVDGNGDLLAGGSFTVIDGIAAGGLARFDGTGWHALGGALQLSGIGQAAAEALLVLPGGELLVGGNFSSVAGVPARSLARYDGTNWHAAGDVLHPWQLGSVSVLRRLPSGDVVAAGSFASIDGVPCPSVARWDGTTWSALDSTEQGFTWIDDLQRAPNGDLLAIGILTGLTGALDTVARWDGAAWSPLPGITGNATALRVLSNGAALVGGYNLTIGAAATATNLAVWDGASWLAVPGGLFDARPRMLAELPSGGLLGDLLVGGDFTTWLGGPTPVPTGRLMRFDGATWSAVAPGTDRSVHDVVSTASGAFAVGDFRSIGSAPAARIARLTGTGWNGQGLTPPAEDVLRVVERLDGSLALATRFGATTRIYHHFVGPTGSFSLQVGSTSGVPELAVLPDGDLLVAAGGAIGSSAQNMSQSPLARLDAATGQWRPIDAGFAGTVDALEVLSDGSIVVAGSSLSSNGAAIGALARWDGAQWHDLQALPNGAIRDIAELPSGDLVIVGGFTSIAGQQAIGIARLRGATWSTFGTGFSTPLSAEGPLTVATVSPAQLLVGGEFTGVDGVAARNIARWDGSTWHAVGTGADGTVRRIVANRVVLMCGDFLSFDDQPSARLATLLSTCLAASFAQGFACAYGTTTPQLFVEDQPMRGGELRTVATGMPAIGLGIGVLGTQAIQRPLAVLGLPAGPQCYLQAEPLLLQAVVAQAGRTPFRYPLPENPSIVGIALFHQAIAFELTPTATLQSIGTTRVQVVRVGSFW